MSNEIFRFGIWRWDVDKLQALIKQDEIEAAPVDITSYAKTALQLNRDEPDARPMSFWVNINWDYIDTMPARDDPIIFVQLPRNLGWVVADGNHRLAKAYLAGQDSLMAYMVPEKQAKECVPWPRYT